MSKVKTAFFCSNCGYESTKWLGKCPVCNQWNTFVEEMVAKPDKSDNGWKDYNNEATFTKAVSLSEISATEEKRLLSTDGELNRVLGGGIVRG
ncbi:MAG: DNA repair protein RadA, partial [Bacteroidota bacterium]|nr:DNA repair protein RadA [Bacteroidota bacterium]